MLKNTFSLCNFLNKATLYVNIIKLFAALKWLQNCRFFEKDQVVFHLRSYLNKFNVLYGKNLQSKKQQTKMETYFHTVISMWRRVILLNIWSFKKKIRKIDSFYFLTHYEELGFNKPSFNQTKFFSPFKSLLKQGSAAHYLKVIISFLDILSEKSRYFSSVIEPIEFCIYRV